MKNKVAGRRRRKSIEWENVQNMFHNFSVFVAHVGRIMAAETSQFMINIILLWN